MDTTEPDNLAPEEELLARWERRIGDIPLGAMSNTERLIHDLGYEVRRLREAMLAARDACLEEYECVSQAVMLEEALGIHS